MKLTNLEHAIKDRNFKEIRAHFEVIENEGTTIIPWVDVLGLARCPDSIGLAHRVRNKLQSAIGHYFGLAHLDGKRFESTAYYMLQDVTTTIEAVKAVRGDLNRVHETVNKILVQ